MITTSTPNGWRRPFRPPPSFPRITSANRHENRKRQIAPDLHTGKGIFNSFVKPKQQQLATPRSRQESAISRNGEFMRTHFKPSKHLTPGGIDLDHVEFRVQR